VLTTKRWVAIVPSPPIKPLRSASGDLIANRCAPRGPSRGERQVTLIVPDSIVRRMCFSS
jgi:hypothetical protein